MVIYPRPRAGGKTHLLVRELIADPNAILLVSTYADKAFIVRRFPLRASEIADRVLTVESARERLRGLPTNTRLLVDNADNVLTAFLGRRPAATTVTGHAQ